MERFAESQFLELMRKNAHQVKVAARAHHFGALAHQLNFAGSVRDRAVFFVGGSRRKNNVRRFRGFRQEHFLYDEQIEFPAPFTEFPKVHQGVRAYDVKGLQLSGLRGLHHLWRGQSRRCWDRSATPQLLKRFVRVRIANVRVAGESIRQESHVRSAA